MADSSEHVYAGQYTQPTFGITTREAGVISDPDANAVTATLTQVDVDPAVVVFAGRVATRVVEGMYEISLSSVDTSTVGLYVLRFNYVTSGTAQLYEVPIEIGGASSYDELSDELKRVVESVFRRFADLYDSPIGGPHLAVYAQTHFGRGRIAQLLEIGVGRLNTIAQPHSTYSIAGGKDFPVGQWGAVLEQVTYVEVIKHLMRSYTEQPSVVGASVTYLDRRDFLNRWQTIYNIEKPDLDRQLDVFKMANMGLGKPGVLVAGGIYGNIGPVVGSGHMASRPRYYYRFY